MNARETNEENRKPQQRNRKSQGKKKKKQPTKTREDIKEEPDETCGTENTRSEIKSPAMGSEAELKYNPNFGWRPPCLLQGTKGS